MSTTTFIFEDLREQHIASSWTDLNGKIDNLGFPPGRLMGRRRVWTVQEVLAWLERQPSDRLPPRGIAKTNRDKALLNKARASRKAARP
jgi:hypothetical protein